MKVTSTFDIRRFNQVVDKQLKAMKRDGAGFMAEAISDQMKDNVDNGRAFEQEKYQVPYAERTVKERKAKGYQTSYADLQRGRKRVKTAFVEKTPEKARIKFSSGGALMLDHNFGVSKHLPRRQLFPDIQGGGVNSPGNGKLENPSAMPKKIVDDTHKFGARLMNNV
jgi:hypothetical protein